MFTDIDKPSIDDIEIFEDYVIVSWKPSVDRPSNPASEFVVEYRPEGLTIEHFQMFYYNANYTRIVRRVQLGSYNCFSVFMAKCSAHIAVVIVIFVV